MATCVGLLSLFLVFWYAAIHDAGTPADVVEALAEPSAVAMVLLGTLGALLVSFPASEVAGALGDLRLVWGGGRRRDADDPARILAAMRERAAREGPTALAPMAEGKAEPLMRQAIFVSWSGG